MSSLTSSFVKNNSTTKTGSLSSSNVPLGSEIGVDEAPTPPISNRGVIVSAGKMPPPLSLPDPATIKARQSNFDEYLTRSAISEHGNNHGTHSHNGARTSSSPQSRVQADLERDDGPKRHQQRIPRFSDPAAPPITIKRRLQPPTKLVVATAPTKSPIFYRDNDNVSKQRNNNPRKKLRLPSALPEPILALALNNISVANLPWLLMMGPPSFSSSAASSSKFEVPSSHSVVPSQPTSLPQQIESSTYAMLATNPFVQPWQLPFLVAACDVLKSGIPFKLAYHMSRDFLWIIQNNQFYLVRRRLLAWWRRLPFTSPVAISVASKTQQHRQKLITQRNRVASAPTSASASSEVWVISGIPNYGQTCFLNAVLQALASLEPFVIYLERIVQVSQQEQHQQQEVARTACGVGNLSHDVWKTLLAINGVDELANNDSTSTAARRIRSRRIDPRPILKRIGENNVQFKCYATSRWGGLMEQQDAQELLQALLGVVIKDGHLDLTSSSLESTFATCGSLQASPPRRAPPSALESRPSVPPVMPVLNHDQRSQQLTVQPLHSRDGRIVSAPSAEDSSYDADDEKLTTVLATAAPSVTMTLNLDPGLLLDWSPALSPASSTAMDQNVCNSPIIQNSNSSKNNVDVISSQRGDSVLSLSSLLHRIDAEQRSVAEQQQQQEEIEQSSHKGSNDETNGYHQDTKEILAEKPKNTLSTAPRAGETHEKSYAAATTTVGLITAGASMAASTTATSTTAATSPTTTPLQQNTSPGSTRPCDARGHRCRRDRSASR